MQAKAICVPGMSSEEVSLIWVFEANRRLACFPLLAVFTAF